MGEDGGMLRAVMKTQRSRPDSTAFWNWWREYLARMGASPTGMARKMGFSPTTGIKWYDREVSPGRQQLGVVARYSGTPLTDLLRMAGYEPQPEDELPEEGPPTTEELVALVPELMDRLAAIEPGDYAALLRKWRRSHEVVAALAAMHAIARRYQDVMPTDEEPGTAAG